LDSPLAGFGNPIGSRKIIMYFAEFGGGLSKRSIFSASLSFAHGADAPVRKRAVARNRMHRSRGISKEAVTTLRFAVSGR
jgi:hypothetical protein